ncbi:MAG TPA: metal ABC transporter permease [Dongiaceae bacterium]|nr:metal ABC transporter permease [Dongiaceae bacterium]
MSHLLQLDAFWRYDFLGRALLAACLMGLGCGLLSPLIVLRRLSFSADGLAHASLGGLALGIVLLNTGLTPTLGGYLVSFVFTCLVAVAIAFFSGGNRLQSDTAVGACYVAAFALGVLLLSMHQGFSAHLDQFLFGSILAVEPLECGLLAALAGAVALFCFLQWRWLGQWTFDEELARASGVPASALRYGLIVLIAATVILSVKVVGVLLVTSMLILPGAIGTLSARRLSAIVACSVGAALGSCLLGIVASNASNIPPGPAMVLVAFGAFVTAYWLRSRRDRRAHRAPQSSPS